MMDIYKLLHTHTDIPTLTVISKWSTFNAWNNTITVLKHCLFQSQPMVTLASGTAGSFPFNTVAALSYSGASFLQWPHLEKV